MAKKIILLGLLLIALLVSSCVWYGGHGHGYGHSRDTPSYGRHPHPGWDRHIHDGGHHRR